MMTARHKLGWFIMEQGQFAVKFQQVYKRMHKLAPLRLKQLTLEHQDPDGAVARATRKALTDPRYLDYIEQTVEMAAQARAARIQRETHLMYHYAIQQRSM